MTPGGARGALRQNQRQQDADRGHGAIAGDQKSSEVEENWMHWR